MRSVQCVARALILFIGVGLLLPAARAQVPSNFPTPQEVEDARLPRAADGTPVVDRPLGAPDPGGDAFDLDAEGRLIIDRSLGGPLPSEAELERQRQETEREMAAEKEAIYRDMDARMDEFVRHLDDLSYLKEAWRKAGTDEPFETWWREEYDEIPAGEDWSSDFAEWGDDDWDDGRQMAKPSDADRMASLVRHMRDERDPKQAGDGANAGDDATADDNDWSSDFEEWGDKDWDDEDEGDGEEPKGAKKAPQDAATEAFDPFKSVRIPPDVLEYIDSILKEEGADGTDGQDFETRDEDVGDGLPPFRPNTEVGRDAQRRALGIGLQSAQRAAMRNAMRNPVSRGRSQVRHHPAPRLTITVRPSRRG